MSTPSVALPLNSASTLTTAPAVQPPAGKGSDRAAGQARPEVSAAATVVSRQDFSATAIPAAEEALSPRPVAATEKDRSTQAAENDNALTRETLERLAEKVHKTVRSLNNQLQFQIDDETSKLIIKVIDTTTKEVIKQIPPQELVEIAKALDKLQGLLVREQA